MILPATNANIEIAAAAIRAGRVAAFPTETVYGLGANAWNDESVRAVYALKGRPANHPLIVHIAAVEQIDWVAARAGSQSLSWSAIEARLNALASFWPGALSILLPKSPKLAESVCQDLQYVAVRIPAHETARKLITFSDCPLAAPSANRFGRISPTEASHVASEFIGRDFPILDGGRCMLGLESTIVQISEPAIKVLRPGAVTLEQLQALLPSERFELTYKSAPLSSGSNIRSPGLLESHYSPHTPLFSAACIKSDISRQRVGIIAFSENALQDIRAETRLVLSASGDLNQVSQVFFSALRQLDALALDAIIIDTCDEQGLGWALCDRIARAAGKGS